MHLRRRLGSGFVDLFFAWNFDPEVARAVVGLPNNVEPIVFTPPFTPQGYPGDMPGLKPRKSVADLGRYKRWWGWNPLSITN